MDLFVTIILALLHIQIKQLNDFSFKSTWDWNVFNLYYDLCYKQNHLPENNFLLII